MLSQAQKKIFDISDVKGGVGVEKDAVVEVGSDAVDAFDNLVDDRTLLEQRCFLLV